ncbi:MAG: glycoside hydrolase family 15 protein, partial [Phycisphaerales bacterium]
MVAIPSHDGGGLLEPSVFPPIHDYGLIGNCRSAALVSRAGSIDWLCLPRFDSPSVLGALLDPVKGGRFVIRPRAIRTTRRAYAGPTNVLRTEFLCDGGALRLTDLMPVAAEGVMRRELWPDHEILRIVECTAGEVELEMLCDPRPAYGEVTPCPRRAGFPGWELDAGLQTLYFLTDLDAAPLGHRPGIYARARLRAGDRRVVSLAYSAEHPAVLPVLSTAMDRLAHTLAWWEAWSARTRYDGPHQGAVTRSALALKLMTYAPSGAIIAAPTTSLPERPGGDLNWDYRYCWPRDASFTVRALLELGHEDEAAAFISWLLHATRLTFPRLSVLYDVHGRHKNPERELALEGYRGSRPVRAGNAAWDQLQLDAYGAVADAAYRFTRAGGTLDKAGADFLVGLGETAAELWTQPDEGIWEPRTGRRQHTLSKAMCWVALDRLDKMTLDGLVKAPRDEFRTVSRAIRAEVEARGYSRRARRYTAELDGEGLDAGLLLLSLYGYADPRSERMRATVRRVVDGLSAGPLLHRNRGGDGLTGAAAGEGAFGLCGFWAVEALARQGDLAEAADRFERLLPYANDLGLFAEETDPLSGEGLGNFPQAYTHVGVINAARTLLECERQPASTTTPREAAGRTAGAGRSALRADDVPPGSSALRADAV